MKSVIGMVVVWLRVMAVVMAVVIANRRIIAGYWRMLLVMAAPQTAVGA